MKIIRENASEQNSKKPRLKFNPGLALIGFRTTGPCSLPWIFKTVRARKILRIQKYLDMCERANSIWTQIRVEVEIFVSGKKKLPI